MGSTTVSIVLTCKKIRNVVLYIFSYTFFTYAIFLIVLSIKYCYKIIIILFEESEKCICPKIEFPAQNKIIGVLE